MALRALRFMFNAVFAFAFTPSPLKLITCNKQWVIVFYYLYENFAL